MSWSRDKCPRIILGEGRKFFVYGGVLFGSLGRALSSFIGRGFLRIIVDRVSKHFFGDALIGFYTSK